MVHSSSSITIIVPTYNECGVIGKQLSDLRQLKVNDVIVVDGQSTDETRQIVEFESFRHVEIRLMDAPRSRPKQMNMGAARAEGEWLLFLHADTELPASSYCALMDALQKDPAIDWGAFYVKMSTRGWYYSYLEWYSRVRSLWFKLPYGDQALFVRRRVFEQLDGFRIDHPIMEDVELVRRLGRRYHFRMVDAQVVTSARRFEEDGAVYRGFKNLAIQLLYLLGVTPTKLVKLY